MTDDVSEDGWQNRRRSLKDALRKAEELERAGAITAASAGRASAYYAFAAGQEGFLGKVRALIAFIRAKESARQCLLAAKGNLAVLSADELDVLGTIALRGALWIKPDPAQAIRFFEAGLLKQGCPHTRALLSIGLAEAWLLAGNSRNAEANFVAAYLLEHRILLEEDRKQAHYHLMRVHARCYEVAFKLGLDGRTKYHYDRAKMLALDPEHGSTAQLMKLEQCRMRLERPTRWQRYF